MEQQKKRKQQDQLKRARSAIDEMVQRAEATGELAHLYGKPLDLSQDSSEWLVNRFVKEAGFSHPLLEQSKELDEMQARVGAALQRLARRRERYEAEGYGVAEAQAFNDDRVRVLREYREELEAANRSILAFNITAPLALHRRTTNVERALAEAGDVVAPLPYRPPSRDPERKRSFLQRLRRQ